MKQTFIIPGSLDGASVYNARWRSPQVVKRNTDMVKAAIDYFKIAPCDGNRVEITFYERPEKGERARTIAEVKGGAGFIKDALVQAGVINESARIVTRAYLANQDRQRIVVDVYGGGE